MPNIYVVFTIIKTFCNKILRITITIQSDMIIGYDAIRYVGTKRVSIFSAFISIVFYKYCHEICFSIIGLVTDCRLVNTHFHSMGGRGYSKKEKSLHIKGFPHCLKPCQAIDRKRVQDIWGIQILNMIGLRPRIPKAVLH